jgi:histidine triad (HIT) family protein
MNRRAKLVSTGTFVLGLLVGGYLFADSQKRSLLAVGECENCLHPNEIAGLLASVAIQRAPGLLPNVVLETDLTLVIEHPARQAENHVVLIPKRDIKNVGSVAEGDEAYIVDLMASASRIVQERGLKDYRIWSNGPANQLVAYLHFHLAGN